MIIDKAKYRMINRKLPSANIIIVPFDPLVRDGRPIGKMKFDLRTEGVFPSKQLEPVRTPSDRRAYFNLSQGNYALSFNSDYYNPKYFQLSIPDNNRKIDGEGSIVIYQKKDDEGNDIEGQMIVTARLRLTPKPAYPFPSGSTLLRVVALGPGRRGVAQADISVRNPKGAEAPVYITKTDEKGQAVLCCNRMTRDKILQINGIDFESPRNIEIIVKHPESGGEKSEQVIVRDFWSMDVIIEDFS